MFLLFCRSGRVAEYGAVPKLGLDLKKSVVLCDSLAAARSAGLDKSAAEGDCDIGNGGVGGLTASVGDDIVITGLSCKSAKLNGLRKSTDLIGLYENCICRLFGNTA